MLGEDVPPLVPNVQIGRQVGRHCPGNECDDSHLLRKRLRNHGRKYRMEVDFVHESDIPFIIGSGEDSKEESPWSSCR